MTRHPIDTPERKRAWHTWAVRFCHDCADMLMNDSDAAFLGEVCSPLDANEHRCLHRRRV